MCESVGYDNSFIVGGGSRPAWKLGRVVEGAALEMLLGGNLYESSNLSVSVVVYETFRKPKLHRYLHRLVYEASRATHRTG